MKCFLVAPTINMAGISTVVMEVDDRGQALIKTRTSFNHVPPSKKSSHSRTPSYCFRHF